MSNERQQRAARAEQMRKEREKADRKQRNVISIAIVAVVVALVAIGGYAIKTTSDNNKVSNDFVAPTGVNNDYGLTYAAEDAGGTAGANPVNVVLYEDFQCPACQAFEQANGAFLDDAVKNGEITVEYRMFAFLDSQSSTEYSTRSASAAMCVLDQGGPEAYKKFHDLLYANQPPEGGSGLDNATLVGYADEAGTTGLDTCIKSRKYGPWVVKAKEVAQSDGISGTPTIKIDGKVVNGAGGGLPQVADMQAAIAAAKKA